MEKYFIDKYNGELIYRRVVKENQAIWHFMNTRTNKGNWDKLNYFIRAETDYLKGMRGWHPLTKAELFIEIL